MRIISSNIEPNSELPEKYTCLGENVNPPFHILEISENTESLILLMEDLDEKDPAGLNPWVNWLVVNVPPDELEIKENQVPFKAVTVLNSSKTFEYEGPCPKNFTSSHKIRFKVFALDKVLEASKEWDRELVMKEAEGHIIELSEINFHSSPK